MAHDVFISYPHQDKATANAACAKLEASGVRCWIAPRDISPSEEWAAAIVDAIDACRIMLLIFSAHANESKQVHREVQHALEKEKPVVPFRIENVAPEKSSAYYMGPVHWLDAVALPLEGHLSELVKVAKNLLADRHGDERVGANAGENIGKSSHNPRVVEAGPLRIVVGEEGPFCDVPKGGPWNLTRRLKIELRNVAKSQTISGCKIQITEILPFSGYRGPWIMAENIVLAAGDQTYVPVAQYGEARDKKLNNCSDTMIEVCCTGKAPLLQIEERNFLTIRATAHDVPFCEIVCAVWVDTEGRLRINYASAEPAAEQAVDSAINSADALCILTGTGKPFDRVDVNKYGIHHTIYAAITNVGSTRISNCNFYRTYVAFTNEEEKVLLDGPFSLDPKERRYVPIAMFNETKDLPHANHLIGLSMHPSAFGAGVMQPRLPPDRRHIVSFVAESTDCKDAVLNCEFWVNENGELRMEIL